MKPHFFSECDLGAGILNVDAFDWHFCYWHGAAEQLVTKKIGDRQAPPPDICVCNEPMPTEPGSYECTLYGAPACMVIAQRFNFLQGRGYLLSDTEQNILHCQTPEMWR